MASFSQTTKITYDFICRGAGAGGAAGYSFSLQNYGTGTCYITWSVDGVIVETSNVAPYNFSYDFPTSGNHTISAAVNGLTTYTITDNFVDGNALDGMSVTYTVNSSTGEYTFYYNSSNPNANPSLYFGSGELIIANSDGSNPNAQAININNLTSSGMAVGTYTFPSAGVYDVTLSLCMDYGQNQTKCCPAIINDLQVGLPDCDNVIISYDCNTNSYAFSYSGQVNYLSWNFADGTPVETPTINSGVAEVVYHQFPTTGRYNVSLNVDGQITTCAVSVYGTQDNGGQPVFTVTNTGGTGYGYTYVGISFSSSPAPGPYEHEYTLDYGDNSTVVSGNSLSQNSSLPAHTYASPGNYTVTMTHTQNFYDSNGELTHFCSWSYSVNISVSEDPCCSNFAPEPGERYWLSAWVMEDHPTQQKTYSDAFIELEFTGAPGAPIPLRATGEIIDGWQRIVGDFTVPTGATELKIHLVNGGTGINAFFDDIRVHPFNASMKSYVYDPETLWLTAELDDNNYATFYEYDKEGQLIRIKKETARGIMTIQESRSSNPKKDNP